VGRLQRGGGGSLQKGRSLAVVRFRGDVLSSPQKKHKKRGGEERGCHAARGTLSPSGSARQTTCSLRLRHLNLQTEQDNANTPPSTSSSTKKNEAGPKRSRPDISGLPFPHTAVNLEEYSSSQKGEEVEEEESQRRSLEAIPFLRAII